MSVVFLACLEFGNPEEEEDLEFNRASRAGYKMNAASFRARFPPTTTVSILALLSPPLSHSLSLSFFLSLYLSLSLSLSSFPFRFFLFLCFFLTFSSFPVLSPAKKEKTAVKMSLDVLSETNIYNPTASHTHYFAFI
jgi:hypothetical protein